MKPLVQKGAEILMGAAIALLLGFAGIFFTNPFVLASDHEDSHSVEQQQLLNAIQGIAKKIEADAHQRSYDLELDGLRDKIDGITEEVEKLTVELEEAPNSTLVNARERRKRELLNKRSTLERDLDILMNRGLIGD